MARGSSQFQLGLTNVSALEGAYAPEMTEQCYLACSGRHQDAFAVTVDLKRIRGMGWLDESVLGSTDLGKQSVEAVPRLHCARTFSICL